MEPPSRRERVWAQQPFKTVNFETRKRVEELDVSFAVEAVAGGSVL